MENKFVIKNLLPLCLLVLCSSFAKAQKEFLVTVDPATGLYTIVDSLPGVNFIAQNVTAIDKVNHRYFFKGIDFGGTQRLYTVNTLSGAILSQPVFPANVAEFHYDNVLSKLFGLQPGPGGILVKEFDPATTASVAVDTLFGVPGIVLGSTAYDEVNHRFITPFTSTLYFSNTVTSATTTVTTTASNYSGMQYDNASGTLYGMTGSPLQLGTINTVTGAFAVLGTTASSGCASNLTSINELNHTYTFGNSTQLYTLNASATTLHSPAFPVVAPGENIIELHYDNASGILYGLHWGNDAGTGINDPTPTGSFSIYPNPFNTMATLSFSNPEHAAYTLNVYNILGQNAFSITNIVSDQITIDRGKLEKGTYLFRLSSETNTLHGKFIIE